MRSLGDLAREHIFRNGASQFLTPEGLVAQAPSVHTPPSALSSVSGGTA